MLLIKENRRLHRHYQASRRTEIPIPIVWKPGIQSNSLIFYRRKKEDRMSARLLKKFLKEQELQQQQHHVEDEEEEEAAESPDSENRPAINPFDLLNDDDVDQVLFLIPRSYCTAINWSKPESYLYFKTNIAAAFLFISFIFLGCLRCLI